MVEQTGLDLLLYSFLLEKNGRLNPFFVQLPQHATSRNAAFNTANPSITTASTVSKGAGYMVQAGHSTTETTQPQPGDMFTITDSNDSLHTKAYRVTRVMSNGTYNPAPFESVLAVVILGFAVLNAAFREVAC